MNFWLACKMYRKNYCITAALALALVLAGSALAKC